VNPLTEIVLAHAYELQEARFSPSENIEMSHAQKQGIVVALKGWRKKGKEQVVQSDSTPVDDEQHLPIPTFFSRTGKPKMTPGDYRGFLVEHRVIERPYTSQDQVADKDFFLLSHLVVMKNPFSKKKRDTLLVLLNGVSGPATFALAEVLTGGKSPNKAVDCEKLLADFNRVWGKAELEAKRKGQLFGVEGIIEVKIQPKKQREPNNKQDSKQGTKGEKHTTTVDEKFYDKREVLEWHLLNDPQDQLATGNPRAFYFTND
jgi:hypothetical protein